MQITLAGLHGAGLLGLCRVAGRQPSSPLFISPHDEHAILPAGYQPKPFFAQFPRDPYTHGVVLELDWQSKRYVRTYQRGPLPNPRYPSDTYPSSEGSVERPLHNIRKLIANDDDVLVISSGDGGCTCMLDLISGEKHAIVRQQVPTAACTLPVTTIALGSHGPITLLRWPSGGAFGTLPGHHDGARDMAFSPDGRFLVSVGGESEDEQHRDAIRLWDVQRLAETHSWKWHHLSAVAYHPGGEVIAVGCMMPSAIKLWRPASDEIVTIEVDAPGGISGLCFSPDGEWLWAVTPKGMIMLFAAGDC